MAGYGDDAGFAAWLADNGYVLPVDAPDAPVLRQRGSDYLDAAYEAQLQCSARAGGFEQERAWPRAGHKVGAALVPVDLIPPAWINASYRAAWLEASQPGWASGSINPNRITKREKVDVIEREFFGAADRGAVASTGGNTDAQIDGMLTMWFCPVIDGGTLGIWAIGS